ncbi:hypothetical protein [Microbacterium sp. SS28]|uniref:DUF7144 family membrane protein n=1 Tax=Microbacterium sp. SS28 TaxID=2919948 RepID=UPI001FAB175A|nr:hypothetical protein [Microbacterium sp. SS28]
MSNVQKQSGWVGWAVFGGIVLIIVGVFNALFGLAAIIGPSSAYFVTITGSIWLVDVTTWGWWHLIVGLLIVLVGVFVLRGATWARITGVVLVSINAVSQFASIPYSPWLALTIIALDLLVIFALVVYGKELQDR